MSESVLEPVLYSNKSFLVYKIVHVYLNILSFLAPLAARNAAPSVHDSSMVCTCSPRSPIPSISSALKLVPLMLSSE